MSNKRYWVEESYLTSIADTIRNKTGKTDKILFPDGFFDEIINIETTPATALPVLDVNYPQDTTIMESADGSATFNISIVTPGKPAEYTYQWYVNGVAVDGATSMMYTKSGLTSAATYNVYCEVTNKAGTVTSRVATLAVKSSKPTYTYSGTATLVDDGGNNWRIKFLTGGTLKFTELGTAANTIDVFCVGGGGGGSNQNSPADGGGGGGYTKTSTGISVAANTDYTITVGAGGGANTNGGYSSAFGCTAAGGYSGKNGGNGGSGGGTGWPGLTDYSSAGGNGGSDGNNGTKGYGLYTPGYGQRNKSGPNGESGTTREFATSGATLYAGGGGGKQSGTGGSGGGGNAYKNGTTNLGGGGGACASGGSGIVIIRNHR